MNPSDFPEGLDEPIPDTLTEKVAEWSGKEEEDLTQEDYDGYDSHMGYNEQERDVE